MHNLELESVDAKFYVRRAHLRALTIDVLVILLFTLQDRDKSSSSVAVKTNHGKIESNHTHWEQRTMHVREDVNVCVGPTSDVDAGGTELFLCSPFISDNVRRCTRGALRNVIPSNNNNERNFTVLGNK